MIPDFLAVGDAADGYPGIAGISSVTAAQLLNRHGRWLPAAVLGEQRDAALLFKEYNAGSGASRFACGRTALAHSHWRLARMRAYGRSRLVERLNAQAALETD